MSQRETANPIIVLPGCVHLVAENPSKPPLSSRPPTQSDSPSLGVQAMPQLWQGAHSRATPLFGQHRVSGTRGLVAPQLQHLGPVVLRLRPGDVVTDVPRLCLHSRVLSSPGTICVHPSVAAWARLTPSQSSCVISGKSLNTSRL